MTLPPSRWQSGVVSQWRNADAARPSPKSWHAEQMKLYVDTADEVSNRSSHLTTNRNLFIRPMKVPLSMTTSPMWMTPTLNLCSTLIYLIWAPLSIRFIRFNSIRRLPKQMALRRIRGFGIRQRAVVHCTLKWMTRNKASDVYSDQLLMVNRSRSIGWLDQ